MGRVRALVQRRRDRGITLAPKLVLPVMAAMVAVAAGFLMIAVPAVESELEQGYAAEARQVAGIVQQEYVTSGADAAALDVLLEDHVRFDPSILRIDVYRLVSGSPVVWASSDPSERAGGAPDPYEVQALRSGATSAQIVSLDGVRTLQTVLPIEVGGSTVATIGLYSSLQVADATITAMTRLVVGAAVAGVLVEMILAGLILELVVLRPLGRLHRAALRVAAGDLSVRLPEGSASPSRDEIAAVAREFDHMVQALATQRAASEAAAAQLHEEKLALERANAELEAMYDQQSRFVSIVSHEFRTPLTGIQGFSEILRDEEIAPAEVHDFATDINREAKRLGRLIGDMLDLDRMRSGRVSLRLATLDLHEIIGEVVRDMGKMAADHPMTLRLDAGHPQVRGDRDKLVQVVTNLVSNAVKYSPQGGPIEISTAGRDGVVDVAVRDRGIGIPADELERVFEPYTRLEHEATRTVGGTGLGLPIVREILRLHGGRVWAESALGQGSTFHFTVPVASADAVSGRTA